ncbi:hypothetical protein [Ruminococcus sp.]|uniref:hypothetical protein n=1 Tax=Ruminococcus sp. TaxID=41978 RepID=UPI0038694EA2
MSIYKIADLFINIQCKSEYAKNLLKNYLSDAKKFDFSLEITAEDIKKEKNTVAGYSDGMYEATAILRKLSNILLLNYNGALIHCAVIAYNGKAYAFSAPSGTGKTTHIKIWQKCLGDKVKIINGDKPFIRYINGKPIAFGTPWQGKENLGSNAHYPLDGIFILKRGLANSVKTAKSDTVFSLINSIACPKNQLGKIKALEFLDRLSHDVKIFELSCKMEDDACYTALKAIEGEINED